MYIALDTSAWVTRLEQPKDVKDEVKAGLKGQKLAWRDNFMSNFKVKIQHLTLSQSMIEIFKSKYFSYNLEPWMVWGHSQAWNYLFEVKLIINSLLHRHSHLFERSSVMNSGWSCCTVSPFDDQDHFRFTSRRHLIGMDAEVEETHFVTKLEAHHLLVLAPVSQLQRNLASKSWWKCRLQKSGSIFKGYKSLWDLLKMNSTLPFVWFTFYI